jgi:5-deoxy-glucuronate isomerase
MSAMENALKRRPQAGFPIGHTAITREGLADAGFDPRIDFGITRLAAGETLSEKNPKETAWVLLSGSAQLDYQGDRVTITRRSLFEELPSALHLGPGTLVTIRALETGAEFAVVRTTNGTSFPPRLFLPGELSTEYRGKGLVQDACLRQVRLIFDQTARPVSNLVIGEVVNYPGRWSSYPPHHHDQPEVYHYRFTEQDGYGHAELGEHVVKVRAGDTTLIPPGLDHAQVSAPGYGMYYLWLIRHLPGNPYTGFTFTEEHRWTLDPAKQGWLPPASPQLVKPPHP